MFLRVILVVLAVTAQVTFADATELDASSIRLEFNKDDYDMCLEDETGSDVETGGLIYQSEPLVNGNIVVYDENHDEIKSYPVKVNLVSIGATAIVSACEKNFYLSLSNVDGKSVQDLLGSYYGLKISAALIAGVEFAVAGNANGVILGDLGARLMALGVDVSIPKITIYKDTRSRSRYYDKTSDFDDVINLR